jgi:flagellin-specific chaperone FliS
MANAIENTHVRYVVKYNDRTYEHPLHSNKRYFIRNIADVVNILEYCVTQDLKNDLYKPSDKLYNFNVDRLVNDVKEDTDEAKVNATRFNQVISEIVRQMVNDNILRNKQS